MTEMSGIKFQGTYHDTLILAHTVTGGSEFEYGLKYLGTRYLRIPKLDETDLRTSTIKGRHKAKKLGYCIAEKGVHGKDPVKADYWLADPLLCEKYAVTDAERTLLMYYLWKEELQSNENFLRTYEREIRLSKVVREMEDRGVRIFQESVKPLRVFYEDYQKQQIKIAEKIS